MAQERERVGTYREFTEKILPIIKRDGYNAVQLMAIAEHPTTGRSATTCRVFRPHRRAAGLPRGVADPPRPRTGAGGHHGPVHAHYVKKLNEGINELDGTDHLLLPGEAGNQPYWDSKLFDYGKGEVQHFLLSNVKYWLDEYHFDGFRFDGVTSMIYHHHGYVPFDARERFFDEGVNEDAITYLSLANRLVHNSAPRPSLSPRTSAECRECASPSTTEASASTHRLGMAIPDFWINQLKDVPDEDWNIWGDVVRDDRPPARRQDRSLRRIATRPRRRQDHRLPT